MTCKSFANCPLHDRICPVCLNNEPPVDGPDPGMFKPSERDHAE